MPSVIHPSDAVDDRDPSTFNDVCYKIVTWDDKLPAFDPLPMVKTVLLSPSAVMKFNRIAFKISRVTGHTIVGAVIFRFATFAFPASIGRILAPVAAALHFPGMIVFVAGMRTEYVKVIVRTFDFWFLQISSTICAIAFSAVLKDIRVVLVVVAWVNFSNSLLQETYLRNNFFIVGIALLEWLYFVMLLAILSFGLVDDVHHYTLIAAGNHALSTKDVLANVIGTMTMLSLRNLYRRYINAKHPIDSGGTATQALGYRSNIALKAMEVSESIQTSIIPGQVTISEMIDTSIKRPPLQMHLVAESARFDPRNTIWPRVGALTPISTGHIGVIYVSGAIGGLFATFSLFLPKTWDGNETKAIAASGLMASALFSGVFVCCCQRQLMRRLISSFHFLFLAIQIVAASVCTLDIFSWRWIPACGVASSTILVNIILIVDALTPSMKRRLRFNFWIPITGIVLYLLAQSVLLLDVMVLENWDLQDRVFLDFAVLGRKSQFRVAPFLLSRLVTIFVWFGRYIYVTLTRNDDNALILLRGDVKFDYEGWKKQVHLDPRRS